MVGVCSRAGAARRGWCDFAGCACVCVYFDLGLGRGGWTRGSRFDQSAGWGLRGRRRTSKIMATRSWSMSCVRCHTSSRKNSRSPCCGVRMQRGARRARQRVCADRDQPRGEELNPNPNHHMPAWPATPPKRQSMNPSSRVHTPQQGTASTDTPPPPPAH